MLSSLEIHGNISVAKDDDCRCGARIVETTTSNKPRIDNGALQIIRALARSVSVSTYGRSVGDHRSASDIGSAAQTLDG